jgi:hypothetical protein
MAFNSVNQYSASHKTWDHVGNIIPDVEHSEGERPAGEFKPAAWLPVKFFDKYFENWFVIMPGKAVAMDPDGRLMPAEYGLTSATVAYTASDVTAGVIDVATGLAVTAAKTVTLSNLTGARDATWTAANAGVGSVTSGFMGRYGEAFNDSAKKYAVGLAPYGYLQWAGGDGSNPADLTQHNYQMQHQTAVLCDYVVRLPLIPAQEASETIGKTESITDLVFGTSGRHNRGNIQANAEGRYDSSTGTVPVLDTYPVMALALNEENMARQTARTTLVLASSNSADDVSDILVNERSALSAVTQAGDYWVDYIVGVIFIYSADGTTLPTSLTGAAGTVSLTYYRYGTAPSVLSEFASVLSSDIKPGDFLKAGTGSNLVTADPTSDDHAEIIGQVLALEVHPRDALDRVRTAFNPALDTDSSGSMANGVAGGPSSNVGQLDQMAGSASGGYPAALHYAGAADTLAIINLIGR